MSVNVAKIEGVVGRDPEYKQINQTWTSIRFSLAWKSRKKEGDKWVDGDTNWFNIELWTKDPESFSWLSKGSVVSVDGMNEARQYVAKDGAKKTAYCIKSFENVKPVERKAKSAIKVETSANSAIDEDIIPF